MRGAKAAEVRAVLLNKVRRAMDSRRDLREGRRRGGVESREQGGEVGSGGGGVDLEDLRTVISVRSGEKEEEEGKQTDTTEAPSTVIYLGTGKEQQPSPPPQPQRKTGQPITTTFKTFHRALHAATRDSAISSEEFVSGDEVVAVLSGSTSSAGDVMDASRRGSGVPPTIPDVVGAKLSAIPITSTSIQNPPSNTRLTPISPPTILTPVLQSLTKILTSLLTSILTSYASARSVAFHASLEFDQRLSPAHTGGSVWKAKTERGKYVALALARWLWVHIRFGIQQGSRRVVDEFWREPFM